jgi:hypothetical protein
MAIRTGFPWSNGVVLVSVDAPVPEWHWAGRGGACVPALLQHLLDVGIPIGDSRSLDWRDGQAFLEALAAGYGDGAPFRLRRLPDASDLPPDVVAVAPRAYEYNREEGIHVGPEVVFARTVVFAYRAWKHLRRDPRAPWPFNLPPVFMPRGSEDANRYALRVCEALCLLPGGHQARLALGPVTEWRAWVRLVMTMHGDTGLAVECRNGAPRLLSQGGRLEEGTEDRHRYTN